MLADVGSITSVLEFTTPVKFVKPTGENFALLPNFTAAFEYSQHSQSEKETTPPT